jgi:acetyl-CoA carboxylase carboxyl transferase subunit alpha
MAVSFLDFEQPIAELEARLEELGHLTTDGAVNVEDIFANLTPWQITQLARHPQRPYTLDYIAAMFTDFQELHGDRMYADDLAIVGGLARFERPVHGDRPPEGPRHQGAGAAQLRHAQARGLPQGAAPDEAGREVRLPLFTFIDTPGAYPGIGAEERGQSEAIGRNLFEMASCEVPIIARHRRGRLGRRAGDRRRRPAADAAVLAPTR